MDATSDWITLPNQGYYIIQTIDGIKVRYVPMIHRNGVELWFGMLGPN